MALRWFVRPNVYYDSVKLMRVSEALGQEPGVSRASAVMATPLNLELLAADDLLPAGVRATPDDLVVSVAAESEEAAERALERVDALLSERAAVEPEAVTLPPRALELAADASNLAVIAVPGPYAAVEAFAALRAGLHVFLFSDNVPVEEEVRLKRLAAELDLLMMGPDCGTAIIGGTGLGFANRVGHGPVGIVGASGTGIQQVCCLLDAQGIGITQAIGTGGRDLSSAVGGSMTRRALHLLDADAEVEIIALISKPADAHTARQLDAELRSLATPVVACLLGTSPPERAGADGKVEYAPTLAHAAGRIARRLGGEADDLPPSPPGVAGRGKRVYGLFAGGTLCSEAGQILDAMEVGHRLIDLGGDEYTRGRAHPIIDPRLRASMLAELAGRDDVGAILLDVILGDLAHPDPAGALLPALEAVRPLPVVAVLVGSRADPQGLERQRATLRQVGTQVFAANARAAFAAGALAGGVG